MKKFKVCVYAICKNEEKFVKRWAKSMQEADEIYVLDTGSTDNSVTLLKENNVNVQTKIINPWRFDEARNESLKLVPEDTDICVCTDLDEVFVTGWRQELELIWQNMPTRIYYNYIWSFDENEKPLVNFYQSKIHNRNNYTWTHPIHEILNKISGEEKIIWTDKITLKHYPDNNKSRSNYLSLLELSVKESPDDDRNMHYLGREYMYHQKYNEAIDTLIKHLNLKSSTWKDERCASMRFIARCYTYLNRIEEAKMWLSKAILESPYLRDPYVELGILYYNLGDFKQAIIVLNDALKIKTHEKTYINEPFSWDNTIYDLLAIAYYNIGNYKKSLTNINKAIKMKPHDQRLLNNKKIIKEKIHNP